MIRVVVVDDHPLVRRGLAQIANQEPDMQVVSEAASGEAVLPLLRQTPCDVLLLDIALPGRSGLEVLTDVRFVYPDLPVLILSVHREDQYARRAFKAGAAGYLTKEAAPEELVAAIRRVQRGGHYVSAALAEVVARALADDFDRWPHEALSQRQYEVFAMLAYGRSVSEIASRMNLSVNAVSTHRARILEKMQMKTNTDLIRYGLRHGLIV